MTLGMLPRQWSIASCLFPLEENPTQPGPGPHPVLILSTIPAKNIVLVAYGSGQSTIANGGRKLESYQFEINPGFTRLSQITRFDVRKSVPLEWSSEWFRPIGNGVPVVMGSLGPAQIIKANQAVMSYKSLLSAGTITPWGLPAPVVISSPLLVSQNTFLQGNDKDQE